MARFKSHPVFFTALSVLGVVGLAAGWAIYDRHTEAKKSASLFAQKQAELNSLRLVTPTPTNENKAAIEADLRRTEAALAKMRNELKGGSVAEAFRKVQPPATPTNAFFNLETFVQGTRQKFQEAGIKVRSDERFGFATYQSEGPQTELIGTVFLQRQVAEYLLNSLIQAKPVELLFLQRERPLTAAERSALAAGTPQNRAQSAPDSDFFDIDPRISARVSGFVNANALRLSFVGTTPTLRTLLNKIATFELPLVVRSVEVEPITARTTDAAALASANLDSLFGGPADETASPPKEERTLLVENAPSKFTVTVELIDLVEALPPQATP